MATESIVEPKLETVLALKSVSENQPFIFKVDTLINKEGGEVCLGMYEIGDEDFPIAFITLNESTMRDLLHGLQQACDDVEFSI